MASQILHSLRNLPQEPNTSPAVPCSFPPATTNTHPLLSPPKLKFQRTSTLKNLIQALVAHFNLFFQDARLPQATERANSLLRNGTFDRKHLSSQLSVYWVRNASALLSTQKSSQLAPMERTSSRTWSFCGERKADVEAGPFAGCVFPYVSVM